MALDGGNTIIFPIYTLDFLLKILLSKTYLHSVRDEYTKDMLERIGIKNVINTGCPTMWSLTEEHCKQIPIKKSNSVVFTITDYNKKPFCRFIFLSMNFETL